MLCDCLERAQGKARENLRRIRLEFTVEVRATGQPSDLAGSAGHQRNELLEAAASRGWLSCTFEILILWGAGSAGAPQGQLLTPPTAGRSVGGALPTAAAATAQGAMEAGSVWRDVPVCARHGHPAGSPYAPAAGGAAGGRGIQVPPCERGTLAGQCSCALQGGGCGLSGSGAGDYQIVLRSC